MSIIVSIQKTITILLILIDFKDSPYTIHTNMLLNGHFIKECEDFPLEKKKNTKEIILLKALSLFSVNGYEGVSIRDIAAAVGIKESSIYNHYTNKQAIFDSIIEEMSTQYAKAVGTIGVPSSDPFNDAALYERITETHLLELSKGLFLFFLNDEYASQFRHMLTIEQYRNPLATHTFINFFIDSALNYQNRLFKQMIHDTHFIDADSKIMALHFYGPIFLLLTKYDHHLDKQEEALALIESHVKQFSKIYLRR